MKSKKEVVKDEKIKKVVKLIAKKDHVILQNDIRIEIKEGDEVKVPERFIVTLRTENVI